MSAVELYNQAHDITKKISEIIDDIESIKRTNVDYIDICEEDIIAATDHLMMVCKICQSFIDNLDEQGGPSKVDYDASYAQARED